MTEIRPQPDRPAVGGLARLGTRRVHRIGYGTMQLEGERVTREQALIVLRAAADAGIDHFDVAQFYTGTNALVAEALGERRNELTLVSKVGASRAGRTLVPAQRPEQLRAQVEENLAALDTDHLDVVNLRRLDRAPGLIANSDQVVDIEIQLAELIALRDAGTIGAIGLSSVSVDQLRAALGAGIVCVQNAYSLVDRAHEPVLALCREQGIAWVPYFPLGSAFPGAAKVTELAIVAQIAAELEVTPAQVGLAWLLAGYENTLLIPGTASPAHLAENIAAGEVHLSPTHLEALNAA